MASPDLDDGWMPYAHELDAALAVADFTKGARIVLREVFAQIFGPAKSRTAAISPTRIADRSGSKRELIARGLKELVDSLVLIPVSQEGPTRYAFAKDYETWLRADGRKAASGERRLSETEVAYCKHATTVAYAYMYDDKEEARNQRVTARSHLVTARSHLVTARSHLVTENVTNGLREPVDPRDDRSHLVTENVTKLPSDEPAPYRNGRAELKKEEEETTTQEECRVVGDSIQDPDAPASVPAHPGVPQVLADLGFGDEMGIPLDVWPGAHEVSPGDVAKCMEILRDHFGATRRDKVKLVFGFYEQQRAHSGPSWIEALREAFRNGNTDIRSIGYIDTIATTNEAKGGKPRRKSRDSPDGGGAFARDVSPSPAYHRPAQLGNREKYLNPKKPTTTPAAKPGE